MKSIFLAAILFVAGSIINTPLMAWAGNPDNPPDLLAMSWNLENFFDWRNDSLSVSDAEFSSSGPRHWTHKRFITKCLLISKTIFFVASEEGRLPDMIALQEVENSFVLKQLIQKTLLRKAGYRFVHEESPDPRGIDVAILYRPSSLVFKRCRAVTVDMDANGRQLQTRDIIEVGFETADLWPDGGGKPLTVSFIACHFPSKFGGEAESFPKRAAAAEALGSVIDSVSWTGCPAIIAGDFNDTPSSRALAPIYKSACQIPLGEGPPGTIRYEGVWETIDMFFVTRDLAASCGKVRAVMAPFLSVKDASHPGRKPLRTYSGPRHLGGVSDHLPVLLRIYAAPKTDSASSISRIAEEALDMAAPVR